MNRFSKFSWFVLFWNVLVILWGTIVRATGSGAGCGSHWPTCKGVILPALDASRTIIEYTHRVMSGGALILVLILLLWGLKKFPQGSYQRVAVIGSAAFIIIEALLGAALVLLRLVEDNSSALRAGAVAIHLFNTLILLSFLALNAFYSSGGQRLNLSQNWGRSILYFSGLLSFTLIGMSGAITALGDTLFPSSSIAATLQAQNTPGAHFLVQLRIYHPIIAIISGFFLMRIAWDIYQRNKGNLIRRVALISTALILIQWAAGTLNVILLAPLWMQVIHLFIADCIWISFFLLICLSLQANQPEVA